MITRQWCPPGYTPAELVWMRATVAMLSASPKRFPGSGKVRPERLRVRRSVVCVDPRVELRIPVFTGQNNDPIPLGPNEWPW